jgi:hypothetical protein
MVAGGGSDEDSPDDGEGEKCLTVFAFSGRKTWCLESNSLSLSIISLPETPSVLFFYILSSLKMSNPES